MTVQAVQAGFGPGSLPFWTFVTHLGDGLLVFAVFAALAWTSSTRRALRVGLVGVAVGLLVGLLKVGVQAPRPYLVDPAVIPWQASGGFGMPSGHAASAVGLFALLWLHHRHAWTLLLALLAVLLVGLSRLYLGVHTGAQVVAGWGLGLVTVLAFTRLGPAVGRRCSRLGLGTHLALAASCSFALGALQYRMSARLAAGFEIPSGWPERMAQARELAGAAPNADAVTPESFFEPHRACTAALLFGMWLLAIAVGRGHAREGFGVAERVLNVLLGTLVLLCLVAATVRLRTLPPLPILLIGVLPAAIAVGVPRVTERLLTRRRPSRGRRR